MIGNAIKQDEKTDAPKKFLAAHRRNSKAGMIESSISLTGWTDRVTIIRAGPLLLSYVHSGTGEKGVRDIDYHGTFAFSVVNKSLLSLSRSITQ
jgi:hypothetical protein